MGFDPGHLASGEAACCVESTWWPRSHTPFKAQQPDFPLTDWGSSLDHMGRGDTCLTHSIFCLVTHLVATVHKYHSVEGGVSRGGSSGHTPCPCSLQHLRGGALNAIRRLAGRTPCFPLGVPKLICAVKAFLCSCAQASCFCRFQDRTDWKSQTPRGLCRMNCRNSMTDFALH